MHASASLRSALVILACLAAGVASAQTTPRKKPPCLEDAQRLCGQVPQDGDWVGACLDGHRDAVSADCRKHLDTVASDVSRMETDCSGDLNRLCGDTVSTAGARLSCLFDHYGALSKKCRGRLDAESNK